MKPLDPVSKIMTSNIIKLNINDKLTKAEELFNKYKIRHLPVVNGNKIVGMLSYTDLHKVSFSNDLDDDEAGVEAIVYNTYRIDQVMTKQITTICPNTPIKEVALILSKSTFNALPVIENDILVGIVTTVDLLKYFISQYKE